MTFSVATWNVNSIKVRSTSVLNWLENNSVDVLALQETKSLDENFPYEDFENAGYNVLHFGEKQYNGVALITRQEFSDARIGLTREEGEQCRLVACTVSGVRCISVYVPNGESLESDKFEYKMNWLDKLIDFLKQELETHKKLVIMGDFNIAPSDLDVYDAEVWQDKILVSDPERQAFQDILDLGLVDVFRKINPELSQYSWWNYRTFAYRRNRGLRIDHILATQDLVGQLTDCKIDEEPRKEERPSDHTVVLASFTAKDLI